MYAYTQLDSKWSLMDSRSCGEIILVVAVNQGIALPRGLIFPYISMGLEVPSMMASFVYTNPDARAHIRRRWEGLYLREDHRGSR